MDTLSPNNGSKSSSSGSSAASSSMDLGKQQQKEKFHRHPRNGPKKLSRSRSLLQLLSRHLGRHFHHQNQQNDTVYSSQDDIRSSSTDSFSLSYERGSHECPINGSSLDLEHTSRTSSGSACSRYSPGLDYYDQQGHIYVEAVYRPGSAMEQLHPQLHFEEDTSEEGSSNEAEDEVELRHDENENENSKPRSASAASAKSSGLHLSRISISSSVSRILHHFSSPTGNASMRSLSCSSTPLRQPKKSLSPNNSNNSSSSSSSSKFSRAPASKKEDKKQQSILRPPVQYVYMKGMSGLYSRVPSYAVCYPYTLQHMY
uniref:IP10645p n=1 Tax=Drosophila melanogaster TaxID=7227 RepID=Q9VV02_DROME|eukprot:NP_648852.1 uncharacterized protein Dmel_CG13054 [Drosophila melanogaster]